VLWNLLRGSHGPRGMRPLQTISTGSRQLELHRPLLGVRRDELREYLRSRRIRWREDASNLRPIAIRNRLRHEAIPLLGDLAGRDIVPALARAAEAGSEATEILDWALARAAVRDPRGRLHLPALRELPAALQSAAVHRFLEEAGVPDLDRATVRRCLGLLDPAGPSAVNLPGARQLRRRAARLFVDSD
jgi:tRNA(Ile)-lysidine synthase